MKKKKSEVEFLFFTFIFNEIYSLDFFVFYFKCCDFRNIIFGFFVDFSNSF